MNVEIYALCHQEAKIIPYFMKHYNQYGQVFLFESHSTDGSRKLAESLGAIIVPFDTGNEVRDDLFMDIKNNCWKDSKADWVIICDMDEFIYHPNFVAYLETVKETIIEPKTYEMISDVYPTTEGQIYEEVQYGFPTRTKMFLFRTQELFEIGYGAGCHDAQPEGYVSINRDSEIICMHMRHLSINHIVQRNAYLASRMSEVNKKNGWGWHTTMPAAQVQSYFDEHRANLVKLV
jgi:hypothetical protein